VFVTDSHLFIGMHRTGTTWVCRVLEAAFGPSQMPVQHTPISDVPAEFKAGRTVVGVVCNPLEWYVSRWAYSYQTTKDKSKRLGFCDYLDRHMGNPQGPIGKACEDFPQTDMRIGAYSYLYVCYFFERARELLPGLGPDRLQELHDEGCSVNLMMRRDNLTRDLIEVFGERVRPHLGEWRNATIHDPWQDYYRDARGKWWERRILSLDAAIFRRWGIETIRG